MHRNPELEMTLTLHEAQGWLKDQHAPILQQPLAAKLTTAFRKYVAQPIAFR